MNKITTFEYTYITYEELFKNSNIHPNISNLKKLNELISNNFSHMLKTDFEGIHIKNFVGIIRLGNTTIEILPKIYYQNNKLIEDDTKTEIYKNLLYMINKSLKIPNNNIDFNDYSVSEGVFFDFLINFFMKTLSLKLLRGTYSTYVKKETNSSYIKGRVLTAKNIIFNPLNLKIYNEFDYYTENNLVNQILKYVVKDMHNKSLLLENKMIAKQILLRLSNVTDIHVTESTFKEIIYNRLMSDYESLLKFAEFYIQNQSLDFESNKTSDIFIFNIDMNIVYQDYISELIKEYSSEITNQSNIYTQKAGEHLIFDKFGNGNFNLKPDITIQSQKKIQVIIDTKYKKLYQKKLRNGVSDRDLYQMFGYFHKYHKPKIILLYPKYNTTVSDNYFFYLNSEIPLNISTVDLKVSLYTSEGEWTIVKQLKEIISLNN